MSHHRALRAPSGPLGESAPLARLRNAEGSPQFALVTGASGGIGRCLSLALAMAGARLCITGRDQDKLNFSADLCRPFGQEADVVVCDLTDDTAINRLYDHTERAFGRLDILVHCAGAIGHGKLEDTSPEMLDLQYTANVRGPLVLTRKVLPLLKRPKGQIVFINSSAGLGVGEGEAIFLPRNMRSKRLLIPSDRKSTKTIFVFLTYSLVERRHQEWKLCV